MGDAPGTDGAEIYAHVDGERGFVCLVNQNPYPAVAVFSLDGTIGLAGGSRFVLKERYPRECPIAEQPIPFAVFGDEIVCEVPAHCVRIIQIDPYEVSEEPVVFGCDSEVRANGEGYEIILRAEQGERLAIGLVLPDGAVVRSVAARQPYSVAMYTFPAEASVVERRANLAKVEVKFPREKAPRAITRWIVDGADEVEMAQVDSPFRGALVHGAFSERLEVALTVAVDRSGHRSGDAGPDGGPARLKPPKAVAQPCGERRAVPVDGAAATRFEALFELPFIEWDVFSPGYDDDTIIELAFSDPAAVKAITASLNGKRVPVEVYRYPTGKRWGAPRPDWWSYFVTLTGNAAPGPCRLALEVEWDPEFLARRGRTAE